MFVCYIFFSVCHSVAISLKKKPICALSCNDIGSLEYFFLDDKIFFALSMGKCNDREILL